MIPRSVLVALTTALLFVGAVASSPVAEEATKETPAARTTVDPEIPVEELELILKALTKNELLVEADGWQSLLREKVIEIGKAEIAVKRQNREIEKAKEIQSQANEAKDQLEEVREKAEQARATGDAGKIQETETAAEAAEETVDEIKTTVDEAEAMDETATAMERAEGVKKEEKVDLLESLNDLRAERTQLIDNLNVVLDELVSKTDEADADTLAKITDYRLYVRSVQGIELDITDTTSTWIAIKGWLVSDEGGLRWAGNVFRFVGILLIAWMVSGLFSRAVRRALGITDKVSQLLEDFLVGAVRWVVMAIGVIMALAAMEISVGPLLAVVGAAGFVIAFALQDSLSNFASGIMILFFRPFDVGDVVDAGGVSGKVVKMNLVSTTIKTFDNKDMLVPNNKIWQDVITNATGMKTRRVDMGFGIGYDDDIDQAQVILEDIVETHPRVLKKPEPTIRVAALADSSVNFICRPWTKTEDYWDVYWDITKAVKQRFDAAGIGIPFPQQDVHLHLADAAAEEKVAAIAAGKASAGRNPQPLEPDEAEESADTDGQRSSPT